MKYIVVLTAIGATLAGCSNTDFGALINRGAKAEVAATVTPSILEAPDAIGRSELRPATQSDPVLVEAPSEPAKVVTNGPFGVTVASLGNPTEVGLWLKTPMVSSPQSGRVTYQGRSANVALIPIKGAATAGSRMSLQAFQALGAPLTDLIEVNVSG